MCELFVKLFELCVEPVCELCELRETVCELLELFVNCV